MKEKMSNIITIIAIVALVLTVAIVAFKPASTVMVTTDDTDRNTISVTGNAELTVNPDEATMYISIVTQADTANQAQDQNKKTSTYVIDQLKDAGIKESDIETDGYYLNKRTEWDPDLRKSVDKGYELRHTLKVTTTDIEGVGNYVDIAVDAGANGVDRVSFGLTKDKQEEVREQALEKAAETAKEKAKNIADALDVNLGRITTVSESNYYFQPYDYRPTAMMYKGGEMDMAEESAMIAPEKVDIRSTVNVAFEIN